MTRHLMPSPDPPCRILTNPRFWTVSAAVYDLLFHAASEMMLTIAADPRHLGARIGIIAVLHTWGLALTHHPHIHMAVPGGGICRLAYAPRFTSL
jgi:hypothetical protein